MASEKPNDAPLKTGWGVGRFAGKNAAIVGGVGALILFPDIVFHLVFEVLHFAIGWIELTIEHAIQEALDVSRHTAQIMTAWIGLAVLIALLAWLYRKFGPRVRACYAGYRQSGREWLERLRARVTGLRRGSNVPS